LQFNFFWKNHCTTLHHQPGTHFRHAPASAHDAKVFQNSKFYLYRNQLFEEQDYVLADSAYPISTTIITPFKNTADRTRQREFNKKYSKGCVIVEQAFGRLKNRFQILKELRNKNTKLATDIIEISLILHNIIERCNDIWESSGQMVIYQMQYDANNNSRYFQAIKRAGEIKRQNLMDVVCNLLKILINNHSNYYTYKIINFFYILIHILWLSKQILVSLSLILI